jgi:GTP-binding protein
VERHPRPGLNPSPPGPGGARVRRHDDPQVKILSAKFHTSAPRVDDCPRWDLREIAFAGRSNVGKSSLINMLANRGGLAKVSAVPGKTQLINFFIINDAWSLVDLPGYGFAKVPRAVKAGFSGIIRDYLSRRANLAAVFVLIDSRHPPQQLDLSFLEWLHSCQIPFALVYTKADKLSPAKVRANIDLMQAAVAPWHPVPPEVVITSSQAKSGRNDLIKALAARLAD